MNQGIIYLAVNRTNGKAYVGQTIGTLRNRAMEHMREGRQVFCRAVRKYGIDQFDWAVLQVSELDQLNIDERAWIERIGSLVPAGYNRCDGRPGASGYRHNGNARNKMSVARKKVWERPEYREKLRKSHWSRGPRAEEIKAELALRTMAQHQSGQLGGYRGGGIRTEASRKKQSESQKRVWAKRRGECVPS